ncbi:YlcG family protein [Erwinia sp. AnSW2-5]
MTDYLRQKWRKLRLFRTRNTFPIDYRILSNTAKILRRAA